MEKYQLTDKDRHTIALMRNFQNTELYVHLKEYHHLLDTLLYLNETLAETKFPIPPWKKYSETLLFKFAFHGYSIHRLLSGIPLSSSFFATEMEGKSWLDVSSAKSILRSKLESFLMFHHIFVNPNSETLKELRYCAWIYTALLHRQKFPAITTLAMEQKVKDRNTMDQLQSEMKQNIDFQKLSPSQQKALFEKGSAKLFNHWSTILRDTGFSENNPITLLYEMLSMYTHSEGLSVVQLESGNLDNNFQKMQARIDLHHSKILASLMILALCNLYSVVNDRFLQLPLYLQWDIEIYSRLGLNPE